MKLSTNIGDQSDFGRVSSAGDRQERSPVNPLEFFISGMSPEAVARLYHEGGAACFVDALSRESHDEFLEALGISDIHEIRGDLAAAIELCMAEITERHEFNRDHAKGRPKPVQHRDLKDVKKTGQLQGMQGDDGVRRTFAMYTLGEQHLLTVDGQPLAERRSTYVDDFGSRIESKRSPVIDLPEATLLLNEYLVNIDQALDSFDEGLSFGKRDDEDSFNMKVDRETLTRLENLYNQYQALTIVFKKHNVPYMLSHILRSPLENLIGHLTSIVDYNDFDEEIDAFLVDSTEREGVLGMRAVVESSMSIVDKLLSDEDLTIRPISLSDSLSNLMACFGEGVHGRLSIDEVEGAPEIIAHPAMVIFILQNFAQNALRMEDVNVRVEPVVTRDYVEFRVHDDGARIDDKLAKNLFSAKRKSANGSGTSLPATSRMMKDLNGLSSEHPEFKCFDAGFVQSAADTDESVKYFYLRVPRVLEEESESQPAQRTEAISDGPQALAA